MNVLLFNGCSDNGPETTGRKLSAYLHQQLIEKVIPFPRSMFRKVIFRFFSSVCHSRRLRSRRWSRLFCNPIYRSG
ncbi:MAG TPA: hypothetical protein VI233_00600 [Puia sp.]